METSTEKLAIKMEQNMRITKNTPVMRFIEFEGAIFILEDNGRWVKMR